MGTSNHRNYRGDLMDKTLHKNFDFTVSYISPRIQNYIRKMSEKNIDEIQEIRLRLGRPVVIVTASGSSFLTDSGRLSYIMSVSCVIPTENEIYDTVNKMCGYSMHSHYEDLLNGYITLPNGSRVGVCGTAVYEKDKVKGIDNINSINIRIPRNVKGVSEPIFEKILSNNPSNIIIAGPPSSGKTTMLKDIAYQLSSGRLGKYHKLCVVDERKEIFPSKSEISNLGPNTDVLLGFPKSRGISMAVRTMSPEYIICDEIGSTEEVKSILDGINCGVIFILSIHARTLSELNNKESFRQLVKSGGFEKTVMLCGSESPCKIKGIYSAKEVLNEDIDINSCSGDLLNFSNSINKTDKKSYCCSSSMRNDA